MVDILIFLLIVLLASYFQSITGFGQGLIAAPITFVLFDKGLAITTLIVVGIIINLYLMMTVKTRLRIGMLFLLLAGAVPGLPLGLIIISSISLPALQLSVGVISVASAAVLILYKIKIRKRPFYSVIAGFFSGVLQTSTALSGPPVILLLAEENVAKQTIRKLLPTYFFIMGIIAAFLFIPAGLLENKGILIGILAAPIVILGGYLGNDEARRIKQKTYRILVMFAVLLTGLVAIYEGLRGLL